MSKQTSKETRNSTDESAKKTNRTSENLDHVNGGNYPDLVNGMLTD